MVRFDLKNLAFMIFIWGMLNTFNGVIIFNHDVLDSIGIQQEYYLVIGTVRMLIGIVALIIFLYIYKTADQIVILTTEEGDA